MSSKTLFVNPDVSGNATHFATLPPAIIAADDGDIISVCTGANDAVKIVNCRIYKDASRVHLTFDSSLANASNTTFTDTYVDNSVRTPALNIT